MTAKQRRVTTETNAQQKQKTVLKPKIVAGIDMMIDTVSSVLAICTNPKTI